MSDDRGRDTPADAGNERERDGGGEIGPTNFGASAAQAGSDHGPSVGDVYRGGQ